MGAAIAAILTYFNAFIDGELNQPLTHIVLLGGSIAAEFAVAAGIILESPKQKAFREWLGMALVLGGVSISAMFTIALFVFDEGISRGQQSEIKEVRCENIALRKAVKPRSLAPTRLNKRIGSLTIEQRFVNALKEYSGTVVKIQSVPDPEAQSLTADLWYLLNMAGWKPEEINETESHFPSVDIREGVTVYLSRAHGVHAEDTKAAEALHNALTNAGVDALLGSMPVQHGVSGPAFDTTIGFIYVAVGPRPITATLRELELNPPTSCK